MESNAEAQSVSIGLCVHKVFVHGPEGRNVPKNCM